MADGGIVSPFQFVDYKIDRLNITMKPLISLINSNTISGNWNISLSVRQPTFYKSRNQYLAGVGVEMVFPMKLVDREDMVEAITAYANIVGLFSVNKKLEIEKHEKNLVFHQAPAILMPYLRAAITSALANAGFGGVILPLINIYAAAEDALKTQELKIED